MNVFLQFGKGHSVGEPQHILRIRKKEYYFNLYETHVRYLNRKSENEGNTKLQVIFNYFSTENSEIQRK